MCDFRAKAIGSPLEGNGTNFSFLFIFSVLSNLRFPRISPVRAFGYKLLSNLSEQFFHICQETICCILSLSCR
jgi:hypothetical protein